MGTTIDEHAVIPLQIYNPQGSLCEYAIRKPQRTNTQSFSCEFTIHKIVRANTTICEAVRWITTNKVHSISIKYVHLPWNHFSTFAPTFQTQKLRRNIYLWYLALYYTDCVPLSKYLNHQPGIGTLKILWGMGCLYYSKKLQIQKQHVSITNKNCSQENKRVACLTRIFQSLYTLGKQLHLVKGV